MAGGDEAAQEPISRQWCKDYMDMRFHGSDKLRDEQLAGLRVNIETARVQMERRLDHMNEFRQQLIAERNDYITRAMYDSQHEDITRRITAVERLIWMALGITALVGAVGLVNLLNIIKTH